MVSLGGYLLLAKHWLLDAPINDALIDSSEGCIYYYYQHFRIVNSPEFYKEQCALTALKSFVLL